ncbi:putative F-box domain-containing protein [Rosa chinensis]|uniref:Putative F-box domain-containing protein n=1 Tax=Rosa chinensis TaxID=74649 RepID=A0A2P6PZK8_ROSCH|nr:putative F-box domain-containing protein [Rosa chinensis]
MSTIEDLPAEILFDIFARLPVKSAFLLRWVCKSFKTLITSSDFIHFHLERNPMKNSSDYLLIRSTEIECMSRICARTFARDLDIKLPENAVYELGSELTVYGSYNGLLCISNRYLCVDSPIYLWNPSIRKIRRLPYGLITSTINDHDYQVTLGMGFHSAGGNDYKVIKFVHHDTDSENTFQVEVYSLNSNSWKRISRVPIPLFHEMLIFAPNVHI